MKSILRRICAKNYRFSADNLLSDDERGCARWWATLASHKLPLIEEAGQGRAKVTFIWRDPNGTEASSPIKRVYLDGNSLSDHHSFSPLSLERIAGTDIWFWQLELPKNWRGTYSFIPVKQQHLPNQDDVNDTDSLERQRSWWRSIMPLAIHDPLNPLSHLKHPETTSPLHLPEAPNYDLWNRLDASPKYDVAQKTSVLNWKSSLQGKERRVWVHVTGMEHPDAVPTSAERPLIVLLDGQNWADKVPIISVLDSETDAGRLPPSTYVMIDQIDGDHREEDLCCNPVFWQAIDEELFPIVQNMAPFSADPADHLIAGQSYGGLAAAFAGWSRPDLFGRIICQSGSFWWPNYAIMRSARNLEERRAASRPAWLAQQIEQSVDKTNNSTSRKHRIFMEVGTRELDMVDGSDAVAAAFTKSGHTVHYQKFEGGHDRLCWRNGLIEGLRWQFCANDASDSIA